MLVLEKTFSSILIPLQIILLCEKIQGHFPNTEQKDKQYSQQLLISMSNVYFYAIVSLAQFAKERNPKNLIIIIIINIFGIFSLQLEERKYTNWYQNHHFFHTVLASCISFPWMPLLFEDGEISTGKTFWFIQITMGKFLSVNVSLFWYTLLLIVIVLLLNIIGIIYYINKVHWKMNNVRNKLKCGVS